MKVTFTLNGAPRSVEVEGDVRVLALLQRLGIRSVRSGCDHEGTCGACSILLDGDLVCSCLLMAPQLEGRTVLTVEGLAKGRDLHPIQAAFLDAGTVQCGYCMPAQILGVKALLDKNPSPSRAQVVDALSGNYCRCTGYERLFTAVTSAAERLQGGEGKVENAEFAAERRVVGKASRRIDGEQLVRAEPSYVEDMVTADALYVRVLASPHASARIVKIDASRARALPGVALVVTHENGPSVLYGSAGQNFPEPSPYDRRLVDDRVRYVGDRVAIVAAETAAIADEALKLIDVEYAVQPAVLSIEEAAAAGAPLVHDRDPAIDPLPIGQEKGTNLAAKADGEIGNVAQGFAQADLVIEREFHCPQVHALPQEPHVVFTRMASGRLVIHAATQVPWHLRRIVAKVLDINESRIRVIKERIGGGFGHKQDIVHEEVAAWVTWQTGRPAYYRMSREEEFISARFRHEMKFRIKVGAKKDGTLTAVEQTVLANTGAYGPHCLTVPMNASSKSLPLLRCPNMKFSTRSYYTNTPIAGAYQGYGAPQGSFATQLVLAEVAAELGLDLVEYMEKIRVRAGDMLDIMKILGEGQEGIAQKVSSCGLGECLARGAELIGWGRKAPDDGRCAEGLGVAIIQQGSGLPGIDAANATVKLNGDGTFQILMGGTDLGTGLDTVAVKIAAELLGVNQDDVSLIAADTDVTPFDVGAYASSGTYFSGSAVYRAAEAMREMILTEAAGLLKCDRSKLRIEHHGRIVGGPAELTIAKVAHHTQGGGGPGQLVAHGGFTTHEAPIPYGAHYARVRVDRRTGRVELRAFAAVQDCGTPINPDLAQGQVLGGALKAIGHSLFEEIVFDETGRMRNPNYWDYKVPMIGDVPAEFHAELVEVKDHLGPFGAKSTSEIAMNGAAPAIAAAIHDAVGVWVRTWPFTAERVLAALDEAAKD